MREQALREIVNRIRARKGYPALDVLDPRASLRDDWGFDSMDLAELTVRIEDAFGVDIFENGLVQRAREVMAQIERATPPAPAHASLR